MYKEMAKTAHEEGFSEIAKTMELVAKIESLHEQRYRDLAKSLENNTFFKRTTNVI
jgi:rubrerythrin